MILQAGAAHGLVLINPCLAALGPAQGEPQRFLCVLAVAGVGRAFIEQHGDITAQVGLDFHAALRGEHHVRTVDVVAEAYAFLGNLTQARQTPHLEATGIGEHGLVPAGEGMQTTQVADGFIARAEAEVVGIAQDNLGTKGLQVFRVQGLYRALRAHRHEDGGGYIAVRQVQRAETSAAGVYFV